MNGVHGQWIEPDKAHEIPARLDRALGSPDRPVLAWIGVKEPGNKTVHVKGQNGETAEIEWSSETFSQEIQDLASQWGGESPAGGGKGAALDPEAVYASRRQATQAHQGDTKPRAGAPGRSADQQLPDPDSVYARRRGKRGQQTEHNET